VAASLRKHAPGVPLVVDPVMVAKGGHRLLQSEAEAALRDTLLPMAALITPNLPEAEVLAGFAVRTEADMRRAAERLAALGAKAVLIKGGHLEGDAVVDLLFHDGRIDRFEDPRIPSRSTHGTGCTLASAIAAGLAQKMPLKDAVVRARTYVRQAIETAPGFGRGHGPLNHAVTVRSD
jgi:hydroxymethylpyrimidine/phosphomethylpyrimidine kinase